MALKELSKDLELVEVEYKDQKATMTFLDSDKGLIREVNFNKQSWDNQKGGYVDDPDKAEKVEKWCKDIFGLTFDTLTNAIGKTKDVYVYDNFNSLFEVSQVDKFDMDMVGEIISTEIDSIEDTGTKISIKYEYDGKLYESKINYGKYVDSLKKWLVDPNNKEKAMEKFEKNYGVPFERKDEVIGKPIMVEVKKAFGKFTYGEVKKLKSSN